MRTKEQILQGQSESVFLTSCYFNLETWAERVLGLELKPFHKDWLRIIKNYDRVAISAPTGFGKTTIFGVTYPLWLAYFKPKSLSIIVAKSIRTQSAKVMEDIREQIENNEILKQLVPKDSKTSWTKEKLVTSNGSKILYSSNTVNIRGLQADYVFADEIATYPDHELFYRDVSTRVVSKKGKLAAVSTPLHTSDLLSQLMNKPEYYSKTYPAIVNKLGEPDEKGNSIWPERFPKRYLMREKRLSGLSNFERNYMCNPRAEAKDPVYTLASVEDCYDVSRTFTSELEGNQVYIGCDFAISSGPTADFDCYIVLEYVGDKIIVKHGERYRGMPIPAKLARLRELNRIYKPMRFVMDATNIGGGIVQQLRSEGLPIEDQSFQSLARRKLLVDLKSVIDSKRLIIPRNLDSSSTVFFTDKLTEELIGFRESKSKITGSLQLVSVAAHDDTVMALAMAAKGASVLNSNFEDHISFGN